MINNRQNGRRRGRGGGQQRPQSSGGSGQRDSGNRIDSRARGNATQLHEKYKNMARDSQMSGDRVNTEYYLQFADHYYRVMSDQRGRTDDQGQGQRRGRDDFDQDDDFGFEGEPVRADEMTRAAEDGARDGRDGGRSDGARGDNQQRGDNYRRDGARDDQQRDYQRDGNRDTRDQNGRDQNGRDQNGRDQNGRDQNARDQGGRDGGRYDKRRSSQNWSDDRQQQPVADDQPQAQPQAASGPVPNPIAAPAANAAANADVAGDAPAEPKRRGRPRKQRDDALVTAPEATFDAAVLPPSLGVSAANDSDGTDEAPKPRRRRTTKASTEASAAE